MKSSDGWKLWSLLEDLLSGREGEDFNSFTSDKRTSFLPHSQHHHHQKDIVIIVLLSTCSTSFYETCQSSEYYSRPCLQFSMKVILSVILVLFLVIFILILFSGVIPLILILISFSGASFQSGGALVDNLSWQRRTILHRETLSQSAIVTIMMTIFLGFFPSWAQYFWNNFCNISQWSEKVLAFVVGSILIPWWILLLR